MKGVEIVKRWNYKGKDCLVLRMPLLRHYCIYVETNLKIGYGQHDELSPCSCIDVHGGITYAGTLSIEGAKPWYFGADFAHFNDCVEGLEYGQEGHVWTLEEVEKECGCFADGVIAYENQYERIIELIAKQEKEIEELKESMRRCNG